MSTSTKHPARICIRRNGDRMDLDLATAGGRLYIAHTAKTGLYGYMTLRCDLLGAEFQSLLANLEGFPLRQSLLSILGPLDFSRPAATLERAA